MDTRRLSAAVLVSGLLAGACASSSTGAGSAAPATKKDSGIGTRTLECVIEEKGTENPSNASGYRTGGNYYMVFEAREGQATSRYRLEVTRQQWQRFQEGQRVKITLNNNILVDIRADE
jgi:hypothetical protein